MTMKPPAPDFDRLVLAAEARELLGGLTAATMRGRIRAGTIPQPVRLSHQIIGWPLSTINKIIRGEPV